MLIPLPAILTGMIRYEKQKVVLKEGATPEQQKAFEEYAKILEHEQKEILKFE